MLGLVPSSLGDLSSQLEKSDPFPLFFSFLFLQVPVWMDSRSGVPDPSRAKLPSFGSNKIRMHCSFSSLYCGPIEPRDSS